MAKSELVDKLRDGNHDAFKQVFQEHYEALCSFLMTMGLFDRALVEDIAQSCFITLWEKRASLRGGSSLRAFLFTMGYRRFLNQIKREKRHVSALEELKYVSMIRNIAVDDEWRSKRHFLLWKLIDELPERCKQVLLLHKVQGWPYIEIAKELGISIKTVESQMRIAYIKIRAGFRGDRTESKD